jgi:hypothetical protein
MAGRDDVALTDNMLNALRIRTGKRRDRHEPRPQFTGPSILYLRRNDREWPPASGGARGC